MNINTTFSLRKSKKTAGQVVVFFFFIAVLMLNVFPFLDGQQELLDFGSFYASGLQIQNGENPYSPDSKFVLEINYPRVGAGGKMVNLNPPISAIIFGVISQFDPDQSLRIWQVASAVLFTGLMFFLTAVYRKNTTTTKFIWAFTIAGFWQTLILGQIYIFLLLFIVLGWVFIQRKRYILGGIAIGLVVALKPNFIIWPIFLLVSGYSVTFLASALISLLISLIPLLSYGIKIYQQWLEASSLRREALILPGNSSIVGLTARLNDLTVGIVIDVILVCALLYLSKQRKSTKMGHSEYVSALGIIAAILASPISWAGYTIFLLPILFSMKKWNYLVIISAAILSFPFIILLTLWQTSYPNFVIFGWFYGWGILSLLAGVVKNTIMTSNIQTN